MGSCRPAHCPSGEGQVSTGEGQHWRMRPQWLSPRIPKGQSVRKTEGHGVPGRNKLCDLCASSPGSPVFSAPVTAIPGHHYFSLIYREQIMHNKGTHPTPGIAGRLVLGALHPTALEAQPGWRWWDKEVRMETREHEQRFGYLPIGRRRCPARSLSGDNLFGSIRGFLN